MATAPHAGRPDGVILRSAVPGDVRSIAEFQTRCWEEAYRELVPQEYLDGMGVDEREVRWRRRLRSWVFRIVLAEWRGALVGVASSRRSSVGFRIPSLELKTLYVDAAWRGRGVAQALIDQAIGDNPAYLWVFKDNQRALAFYAKHGFSPDGRHKLDSDTGVAEIRLVRR